MGLARAVGMEEVRGCFFGRALVCVVVCVFGSADWTEGGPHLWSSSSSASRGNKRAGSCAGNPASTIRSESFNCVVKYSCQLFKQTRVQVRAFVETQTGDLQAMSPALERLLAARAREEREAAERSPGESEKHPFL